MQEYHENTIKELRTKKGLSQSKLSELSGVRKATISDIENGKDFKVSTLFKILHCLGLKLLVV